MTRADDCNIEVWWDEETREWVACLFSASRSARHQPIVEVRNQQAAQAVTALINKANIVYPNRECQR